MMAAIETKTTKHGASIHVDERVAEKSGFMESVVIKECRRMNGKIWALVLVWRWAAHK